MITENEMEKILCTIYQQKDMMHDLDHIKRIYRVAKDLGQRYNHNPDVLLLGAFGHGIVYTFENELKLLLSEMQISDCLITNSITAAHESQTNSNPKSIEGILLHDAHLLEGGKTYIITKSLVTGTIRNQTIQETIKYIENNIIGCFKCILPEAQIKYEQKELYAIDFINDLKSHL